MYIKEEMHQFFPFMSELHCKKATIPSYCKNHTLPAT